MSHQLPEKLRRQRMKIQLESLESPSDLPNMRKLCTMSPVTDLALNLSDTSLGVTPIQDSKRRLAMDTSSSSSSGSPSPTAHSQLRMEGPDTPLSTITNMPKRLLLHSNVKAPHDVGPNNKENVPSYSPQPALLFSPGMKNSPLKAKQKSPAKSASPAHVKRIVYDSPEKQADPSQFQSLQMKTKSFSLSPFKGMSGSSPLKRVRSLSKSFFFEEELSRDSGYTEGSQPDASSVVFEHRSQHIDQKEESLDEMLSNCGTEDGVTPLQASPQNKTEPADRVSFREKSDGFDLDALPPVSEDCENEHPSSLLAFSSLMSNKIILPSQLENNKAFVNPESEVKCTERLSESSRKSLGGFQMGRRPQLRRALSMIDTHSAMHGSACIESPVSRQQDFRISSGFKRPNPPAKELSSGQQKKRRVTHHTLLGERSVSLQASTENSGRPKFVKSHSVNELNIMRSCQLKEEIEDILPDSSRLYALPGISGNKHPSLRHISCDTLADLLMGKYSDVIDKHRIIDARYPFEFEGGHIRGAENWQHGEEEQFLGEFLPTTALSEAPKPMDKENKAKRHILIFHCEFSSQRGPDFYMKLRERDRQVNQAVYPGLYYPECYLLHLGYKEFYNKYPDLCTGKYTEMVDPKHEADLRLMRAKSKSWAGGTVARTKRMGRLHL